jgi:hypothetical protein
LFFKPKQNLGKKHRHDTRINLEIIMKMYRSKLVYPLFVILMAWANLCVADLIVTDTSASPADVKKGYIQNTPVTFTVVNGQSQVNSNSARSMRRVELDINDKKIVVQNSGDKEVYVKGQDPFGSIATLSEQDIKTLKQGLTNLAPGAGKTEDELHQALDIALRLLTSWPRNLPLLIWQDGKQKLYAIDPNNVMAEPYKTTSTVEHSQAKHVDDAILKSPDTYLQLPVIQPMLPSALQPDDSTANSLEKSKVITKALGDSSSDTSQSLCAKIGNKVQGSYPLISSTLSFPFAEVDGTESYKVRVGGEQCLGRCGGDCVDSVVGVTGFGKNSYARDCLDHDICALRRGETSSACNFIFSDASNDFFSSSCKHDLVIENMVVSNDSTATNQASTPSAQENLFVVFTVKNSAKDKLPHNKIYFEIAVDGDKQSTRQLAKVLKGFESGRYFYRIANANQLSPGSHKVSIKINTEALIQSRTSNDFVRKTFTLK